MIVYDEAVSVVDAQCSVRTQFDSSIHTLRQTPRLDGMPIDQIHFDARVSRVPRHADLVNNDVYSDNQSVVYAIGARSEKQTYLFTRGGI